MHIIRSTKDDVQSDLLFVSGRFHANRLDRNTSASKRKCSRVILVSIESYLNRIY